MLCRGSSGDSRGYSRWQVINDRTSIIRIKRTMMPQRAAINPLQSGAAACRSGFALDQCIAPALGTGIGHDLRPKYSGFGNRTDGLLPISPARLVPWQQFRV